MSINQYEESSRTASINEESPLLVTGPIDGHSVHIEAPQLGTHWFLSSFIVINAALGAALLAFPAAFERAGGVLYAMIIQLIFMSFIMGALIILAYCSDIHHVATYQDVLHRMCGRWSRIICAACIAIYCFGTCITFLIIIGDQWDRFLLFVTKDPLFCKSWYMNRKFTISITSFIFILPLCFPKRIDFLRHASAIGVAGICYVAILIIVKYFTGGQHSVGIKTKPDKWTDVFLVIPTICFGYQCHVSVIPIYSCMKDRNLVNFTKAASIAILVCFMTYSSAAVFGYLSFGEAITADVLVAYSPTWVVMVGVFLLAVKIYTTYPILHFCGRAAFESVLAEFLPLNAERVDRSELVRRSVETVIWFLASIVLSVTIPNISDVISLLGGLAAVFIFIFPGMCLLSLCQRESEEWSPRRYYILLSVAIMYIVLGAFIFGLSTAQSIMEDLFSTKPIPIHPKGPCDD